MIPKITVLAIGKEPDEALLLEALNQVFRWYNASSIIRVDKSKTKEAFAVLAKRFGYTPWNKDVYRAFPISSSKAATLKPGQKISLRVGAHSIQSWTTTPEKALKFGKSFNRSYAVVRLLGHAHELANRRWITNVLKQLSKSTPKLRKAALGVLDDMKPLNWEDEVILEADLVNRVQIVSVVVIPSRFGTI